MGDSTASSEQQPNRRILGILKYRKSTQPGVSGAYVGQVDPNDPFFQKGARDTGGFIVTGDQKDDVGVAVIPEVQIPEKPPEE